MALAIEFRLIESGLRSGWANLLMPCGSNTWKWTRASLGSDNGLSPLQYLTIARTIAFCQLDPWEWQQAIFESKYKISSYTNINLKTSAKWLPCCRVLNVASCNRFTYSDVEKYHNCCVSKLTDIYWQHGWWRLAFHPFLTSKMHVNNMCVQITQSACSLQVTHCAGHQLVADRRSLWLSLIVVDYLSFCYKGHLWFTKQPVNHNLLHLP